MDIIRYTTLQELKYESIFYECKAQVEYGFILSLLQSGVSDLHHEQSGVWKKGNPIFHYIKDEYSGIWDLNSHTPLYSNFSTVKIWTESGISA